MSNLLRYYDLKELDRQYFIRGTVPDIAPIVAEYTRRTAEVRGEVPCVLNVPYGGTEPERLDIFPSQVNKGQPAPVFVFIHGGFWRALDAADSGFMAKAFTENGACVVVVNYALAPDASMDQIVDQCRAALAWTFKNIASHGGDPQRIYVGGSSAGGHLAGMMLSPDWQKEYQVPDLQIKGGLMLSGLYELEPLLPTHVNEWAKMDVASAHRNSPIRSLPKAGTRLVFTYAPNETDEFKRQTETYMAACTATGSTCSFVAVPGTNHYDICFEMADAHSDMCRATFAMMGLAPS